jgi:hypothetical protein
MKLKKLHFQQCLMTLKGQYFERIKWGIVNCSRENKVQLFLRGYFLTRTALCLTLIKMAYSGPRCRMA